MKYLGKIGAILIGFGFIMTVIGGYIKIRLIFGGVLLLFGGIGLLLYWSTSNFIWKCEKCGNEFKITTKQNIFGMNMGVNNKMLYCPNCKSKTECKGTKIRS